MDAAASPVGDLATHVAPDETVGSELRIIIHVCSRGTV